MYNRLLYKYLSRLLDFFVQDKSDSSYHQTVHVLRCPKINFFIIKSKKHIHFIVLNYSNCVRIQLQLFGYTKCIISLHFVIFLYLLRLTNASGRVRLGLWLCSFRFESIINFYLAICQIPICRYLLRNSALYSIYALNRLIPNIITIHTV